MITAIAIDDELPALKVIEVFCSKVDFIDLQKTFNKPNEALKHLRKFPIDLVFVDINMPSLNGIDFYKSVEQNTMAIFTTAYSEYAVEGFNLSAVDYLLKPFTFDRFEQAVNKANEYYYYKNQISSTKIKYIFIRADYSLLKLDISEILFIEGLDDYLKIHIANGRPIVTRMTFKSILEKLPLNEFVRVHRSFAVPVNKMNSIRNKTITINNQEIPIGSSYEETVNKLLKH
ncbi:LytR/AlgR family response regulator transcription factor [Solitalea lacus]|uniref:LytR/AlgR family response regulator transcription factor n=1 Tax=Solitalea lacus TaxID=2911172 RepID=UPI001ED9CF02|nr:LytTR family DNA-binding domain-containing protein [Solitalea lacus]UKJ06504.1 LytTR family DNA-binding domain-containing protein [Solitalea lacus]